MQIDLTEKEINFLRKKVFGEIEKLQLLINSQDESDDGLQMQHNCEVDIKALEDLEMKLKRNLPGDYTSDIKCKCGAYIDVYVDLIDGSKEPKCRSGCQLFSTEWFFKYEN